jgi:hypothetical protein
MTPGTEHPSSRRRERLALQIPVRVRGHGGGGGEWSEVAQVDDVTQYGVSFTLGRALEPGTVVHLSLPMPWRLRQFDQFKDLYQVWGLVRWAGPSRGGHRAGVAFIGKSPPASHAADPSRRYELGEELGPAAGAPARADAARPERRRDSRVEVALAIEVQALDAAGRVASREATVTRNLSRRGAACYTSLDAAAGSAVRVVSQDSAFSATALVRSRRLAGGVASLHLEFVGAEWPLDLTAEGG